MSFNFGLPDYSVKEVLVILVAAIVISSVLAMLLGEAIKPKPSIEAQMMWVDRCVQLDARLDRKLCDKLWEMNQ